MTDFDKRPKHLPLGDHLINSHNLFVRSSIDVRRRYMLVTLGTSLTLQTLSVSSTAVATSFAASTTCSWHMWLVIEGTTTLTQATSWDVVLAVSLAAVIILLCALVSGDWLAMFFAFNTNAAVALATPCARAKSISCGVNKHSTVADLKNYLFFSFRGRTHNIENFGPP